MTLYKHLAPILLALAFMILPSLLPAETSERASCEQGIQRAGFEPEDPYRYEEPGFFSRASHIFGVFTCEVNTDGTIFKILRGQSIIAEDGFYGIQSLRIRDIIENSARERDNEASDRRDAAIKSARDLYEKTTVEIEGFNALALTTLRKGDLNETALSRLGFTQAEIADFGEDLGLQMEAASEQTADSEEAEARRAEEEQKAEAERVERVQQEEQKMERKREKAAKTLPMAMAAAQANNFTQVRALAREALKLNAWTEEEIRQLEDLVYSSVRPLPSSQTLQNLYGYQTLVLLAPGNPQYQQSVRKYSKQKVADADKEKRKQEAANERAAKDRFVWIASRLSRNNSEAQRQYAFEQVENEMVVATGRVSDVERSGIITPPTITIDAGYDGLTVFCRLPKSTSDGALATVSIGQRYECLGTASSYTFIFGSAGMSVQASKIR